MAQEKFSFRKETNLKKKFLILFIFSFNIQSSNLVLDFNNLIVNNFEFTQKTETNSSTIESKGKIFRMENEIKIEITEPSKELYRIIENKIEIYDYDFNQTSTYQIDENNGHILDFIINGVNNADVKDLTNSSFRIKNDDNDILIELDEENGFSLTYIDNMQFKNIINFQVIK
jgi:outer membrane lipoprotein-sorting protein